MLTLLAQLRNTIPAGQVVSTKHDWQSICHEETQKDRNGQEGPGIVTQLQHLHARLHVLVSVLA